MVEIVEKKSLISLGMMLGFKETRERMPLFSSSSVLQEFYNSSITVQLF